MSSLNKILVTGDVGYIGSVLTAMLRDKSYDVRGYDTGYYEDCLLYPVNLDYPRITQDIRDLCTEDLSGIDAIIHLAGLSNDPLGELAPGITEEINLAATIKLAKAARSAGVKRFIYASSQSMYGVSNTASELDEDDSEKNPVTSYAVTKWEAELQLKALINEDFTVVCFRPSTVMAPVHAFAAISSSITWLHARLQQAASKSRVTVRRGGQWCMCVTYAMLSLPGWKRRPRSWADVHTMWVFQTEILQ